MNKQEIMCDRIVVVILYLFIGVITLIGLPFILCFFLIFGFYYICKICKIVWDWLRSKTILPLACTLSGGLMCMCGGVNGFCMGAGIGFFMGVIFEMMRWTEAPISGPPYSNKSNWLPYDDGVWAKPNQPCESSPKYKHERPWLWKGFQVSSGPKEDELRYDLENP